MPTTPPGWHPDACNPNFLRWWDGLPMDRAHPPRSGPSGSPATGPAVDAPAVGRCVRPRTRTGVDGRGLPGPRRRDTCGAQPPREQARPPRSGRWMRRHKIITAIAALFIVGSCSAVISPVTDPYPRYERAPQHPVGQPVPARDPTPRHHTGRHNRQRHRRVMACHRRPRTAMYRRLTVRVRWPGRGSRKTQAATPTPN